MLPSFEQKRSKSELSSTHRRDVAGGRQRLPRGGRVDLELTKTERGWSGVDVRLLETTDAEVDALLAGSAMAIDDPQPPFAPIDPAPPLLSTPPPGPPPSAAASPVEPLRPARPVTP